MKRKLLTTLLAAAALFMCALALSACNTDNDSDGEISVGGVKLKSQDNGYIVIGLADDGITELDIPSEYKGKPITDIGSYAFSHCNKLKSVTIPDSVADIGHNAFWACSSLTNVTLGNGITSIEYGLFYQCNRLTSITIPDSVTSIDESAFQDCTRLKNISIPDGITSIGNNAFYGCNNFNYNVYDNAQYLGNSNNPYVALIKATDSYIDTYTVNERTKVIYSSAFKRCRVTSITIPDSVIYIGNSAFEECTWLTNITVPDNVTYIGSSAFKNCSYVTSVTIPNGITSIGDYTFYGCGALTSITISSSITAMGNYAFFDCKRLTDVYYIGSEQGWAAIKIGGNNEDLINATIHYNG